MYNYIASGFWHSIWVLVLVFVGSALLGVITMSIMTWFTTWFTKNKDKKLTVMYMTMFIPPIITLIYIWRVRHSVGWLITGIFLALGLIGGALTGFEGDEKPKADDTPQENDNTPQQPAATETYAERNNTSAPEQKKPKSAKDIWKNLNGR